MSANDYSEKIPDDINNTLQKLKNEATLYRTQIDELKAKVEEFKDKNKNDQDKIRILTLRADRYYPYIKFENKHFEENVTIPKHE